MKNNKNTILFILAKYIFDIAPLYVNSIKIKNNEIAINSKLENFTFLVALLKKHNNLKFLQLVDICGVDYINKKNRFEVIYNFLSLKYNIRLKIKIRVNEFTPVPSLTKYYSSSN